MYKYYVDGREFETPEECGEYIAENMGEDVYDDMLDDCYGPVRIGGLEYSPAMVLYRVDPIAYRCGMNDYYDSLQSDMIYEIERMDDMDEQDFYGFSVSVEWIDDEEDEEEDEEG